MDFLTLAKERYSVRKFKSDPVPQACIDKILAAGHAAPTACNKQPQKILVVNTEEGLAKIRKCTECHFNAPLVLIVCTDKTLCWKRSYDGKTSGDIDAAIVTTHMMLEAKDLGLGSTWVMWFIPEAVREEFALPEAWEPVALLTLGYPADDAHPAHLHNECREEDEIVSYR